MDEAAFLMRDAHQGHGGGGESHYAATTGPT